MRSRMKFIYTAAPRFLLSVGSAALVFGLTSGCAAKTTEFWTPSPQVRWDDLCTRPIEPVSNGYRILKSEPTRGLFPASIGVTRVALKMNGEKTAARPKHLLRDPRNEFLRWNSAFDDQMAISEVFPIDQRDLGGAAAEPEQIVAAWRGLHARVGVVYAVNELSETGTEMIGALYDVAAAEPIAAMHAQAFSVIPPEEDDEPADLWETDSRALVRVEFERHVYECLRELISRDVPASLESPDGWTPPGPIRPVEWPPRRFQAGR